MRQRTLGFFLVPKVAAEDRENETDEEAEADEEAAVELSSSGDDGDGDDESGDDDESGGRGNETAAVLPLAPLDDNAAPDEQQLTRGTWSIPHHLNSRQIGSSWPRAKRPNVQSASAASAPRQQRPRLSLVSSSFSTPARHRAAAASASARSLRPANASLPLVVETVVERSAAAFPAGGAAEASATTTTATPTSSSVVRRRDWSVSDLRFDDRTGELLAVALCGPGNSAGSSIQHQGEIQLFSDTSLRSSLSSRPFPTFRRRRRRRTEEDDDEEEDCKDEEEDCEDEEGDEEPRERTGELTPLATLRFPDGPLLELAWDCSNSSSGDGGEGIGGGGSSGSSGGSSSGSGSDVVAALVGGSRLSGGVPSSSASGSRRYPSGALALFDLDDEAIFSRSGAGENANRRCATAVIEPGSSSTLSSSAPSLTLRPSAAVSLAAAAPAWTTLCPCTVRSAFAVGDASGKVHLWDRRASLTRAVGVLSSGGASGVAGSSSSSMAAAAAVEGGLLLGNTSAPRCSSSLRSLALLADGQTLVGGCSDGTLRLWDVRACLGGDGSSGGSGGSGGERGGERKGGGGGLGRAGVVSLGGGGGAFSSSRSHSLPSSSYSSSFSYSPACHVGGALPAARGCLRSAVRAVPGVNALLVGTPENDFKDAVALGGVARLCPHPTDAARLGFRLDCGWNGAYVIGGTEARSDGGTGGFGRGDGVGAVSHLYAPPVVVGGAASLSSSSSADASSSSSSAARPLLRGGSWGSASSPASFVVNGTSSSSSPSSSGAVAATLAVVDCLNAGSAAAATAAGNENHDETADPSASPFPSAVLVPIPADKAATVVAVHRASGEVVVGTEDGCLAWFDGCL